MRFLSLFVVILMQVGVADAESKSVLCEGHYQHHLQGVCVDADHIYWSFTTTLVKTDRAGKVIQKVPVPNHHGDLCHANGKLYVAVNLGKFNDPKGNADSWVYVYDAQTLQLLKKHETQEVFHGAGGMDTYEGHFFVVGGLPDGVQQNYVYEYDEEFQFIKKNVINSGHTLLGIQTACFHEGRWYFGCYGSPNILLITDDQFQMIGRYEFSCSLGIVGIGPGQCFSAMGVCTKEKGCDGRVRIVVPDDKHGLRVVE